MVPQRTVKATRHGDIVCASNSESKWATVIEKPTLYLFRRACSTYYLLNEAVYQ